MAPAATRATDPTRPWLTTPPPSRDRREAWGVASGGRGRRAEDDAARRYERAGWRVLARNWRPGRAHGGGEIDLVARRGDVLVFVEVKRRASIEAAATALRPAQRRRLEAAALRYAELAGAEGCDLRFDLVAVDRGGRLAIFENVTLD
jgi:putative endonuclease